MSNEVGWLVEISDEDGRILWFTVRDGEVDWTSDAFEAVRFSRQEDAVRMLPYFGNSPRAVEHAWMS